MRQEKALALVKILGRLEASGGGSLAFCAGGIANA